MLVFTRSVQFRTQLQSSNRPHWNTCQRINAHECCYKTPYSCGYLTPYSVSIASYSGASCTSRWSQISSTCWQQIDDGLTGLLMTSDVHNMPYKISTRFSFTFCYDLVIISRLIHVVSMPVFYIYIQIFRVSSLKQGHWYVCPTTKCKLCACLLGCAWQLVVCWYGCQKWTKASRVTLASNGCHGLSNYGQVVSCFFCFVLFLVCCVNDKENINNPHYWTFVKGIAVEIQK